jgi:hypothetical protein
MFAVLPYGCQFLTLRKLHYFSAEYKVITLFFPWPFSSIVFTEHQFANERNLLNSFATVLPVKLLLSKYSCHCPRHGRIRWSVFYLHASSTTAFSGIIPIYYLVL